jgi:hypothetical protein
MYCSNFISKNLLSFLQLFHLCLSIIDKSASKVLDSEEWEDISRELLEILLIRNTLRYKVLLIRNILRY